MYTVETHYLNIGQGDCSIIIVKDPNIAYNKSGKYDAQIVRVVVFDCGSSRAANAGNSLINKCKELRIRNIHVAIVSHFDTDHFNGFKFLFTTKAKDKKPEVDRLFLGTKLYTIGLAFKRYSIRLTDRKGRRIRSSVVSMYQIHGTYPAKSNQKLLQSLRDYKSFLTGVGQVANRVALKHITERVFSGFPDGESEGLDQAEVLLVNKSEWNPSDGKDSNSDVTNFLEVEFQPEGTRDILGQDLMNLGFSKKLEGIHLWCLAYNGHLIEDFDPMQQMFTSNRVLTASGKKSAEIANSRSLACLFTYENYSAWFGGDLPSTHEDKLTQSILNCIGHNNLSVLKAGHHGSNHSTSENFISDLRPLQAIITCGRGVSSAKSSRLEGTSGEENVHGHPGIETLERLRKWFSGLEKQFSDPANSTFTTWMSRDRVYEKENGFRIRLNEYFDEFGKDFITITNSDIRVDARSDGWVDYPTFETFFARFTPTKKNSILPGSFDQFDFNQTIEQSISLIAKKNNKPRSEIGFKFRLHDKKPFQAKVIFYKRSNKKRDREEVYEEVEGKLQIVGERPTKKKK